MYLTGKKYHLVNRNCHDWVIEFLQKIAPEFVVSLPKAFSETIVCRVVKGVDEGFKLCNAAFKAVVGSGIRLHDLRTRLLRKLRQIGNSYHIWALKN